MRGLLERARSRVRGLWRRERTVAIACQGGGSHAAFTAGVLATLLEDRPENYRVVGLSGASGGAVSATAAWYGLLADDRTPGDVLGAVWDDVAASAGWEQWVNQLALAKSKFPGSNGLGTSPYGNPGSEWGREQLESILADHVEFGAFETLATDPAAPALFVSAVDVLAGTPRVFADDEVTARAVTASAAVPRLFEAVEIDGSYYWDGFLSQNPPVREFLVDDSVPPVDELWVVRLTPRETEDLPKTADAIDERTQQLAETLSLTHELRFVETVNDWLADGTIVAPSLTRTTVRTIELFDEQVATSRLNRRSSLIDDLYADGRAEATNFLRSLDD